MYAQTTTISGTRFKTLLLVATLAQGTTIARDIAKENE
jgi:hypothetical protein